MTELRAVRAAGIAYLRNALIREFEMTPNEIIRERREALKIKIADVAEAASLTPAAYRDVESYEDEACSVVRLRSLRAICRKLDLDALSLCSVECALCKNVASIESFRQPRHQLISQRRLTLGLSRDDLADRVGQIDRAVLRTLRAQHLAA